MIAIAKLTTFIATLVLAAYAAAAADAATRKRRVSALLSLIAVLTAVVTVGRVEAWPYTRFPMLMYIGSSNPELNEIVILAVGADGREYPVDPFSWSPLFPTALQSWVDRRLMRLSPQERGAALAFLLATAESSRKRIAEGERIGSDRWLGAAASPPDWGLYLRFHVAQPFRGIRVYRARWKALDAKRRYELLAQYAR